LSELDNMFEEMFGEDSKGKQETGKKPEKAPEEKEWQRLDAIPPKENKDGYKPSGLLCSRCNSNDASYSPYYKDQWCLNCWF